MLLLLWLLLTPLALAVDSSHRASRKSAGLAEPSGSLSYRRKGSLRRSRPQAQGPKIAASSRTYSIGSSIFQSVRM